MSSSQTTLVRFIRCPRCEGATDARATCWVCKGHGVTPTFHAQRWLAAGRPANESFTDD